MTKILALGLIGTLAACAQPDSDPTASETSALTNYSAENCERQVARMGVEFERALQAPNAEIAYFTTTSKYNPCTCSTELVTAEVTTVTGHAWAASPQWGFKAAEKFVFPSGDIVYVDTQTGHHNVQCVDGRVQWTNWVQWITGDAHGHDQCSTLGCEDPSFPDWDHWCGELLVCPTDVYCTFPESGAACP